MTDKPPMTYSLHGCSNAKEALAVILRCASKYPDQRTGKYHCILFLSAALKDTHYVIWRTKTAWHIEHVRG